MDLHFCCFEDSVGVMDEKAQQTRSPLDNRVMGPGDITAIQANNSSSPYCHDIRPPKALYRCTVSPRCFLVHCVLVISSLSWEKGTENEI